jgi:1-acyl-sn-glycerol-3-phosphate acyltransferase
VSEAAGRTLRPARPPAAGGPVYVVSRALIWFWCKTWLRFAVEGSHHVPRQGPVLLVANHASFIDPLVLGSAVSRPVHYLAKAGLASFAPLRWWLHNVGVSLINRSAPSKDMLRHLTESLERGDCVAMFAEGTRSLDGAVAPFRSGVEFLARRTELTVVPAGIEGSARALPRGAWFVRPVRVRVRIGAPWSRSQVLAPGGLEQLRAAVAALARAPLAAEPRVDPGPGPVPADPETSSADRGA